MISSLLFQPPTPTYLHPSRHIWLNSGSDARIPAFFIERPHATVTILFSHGNAEDLGMIYDWFNDLSRVVDFPCKTCLIGHLVVSALEQTSAAADPQGAERELFRGRPYSPPFLATWRRIRPPWWARRARSWRPSSRRPALAPRRLPTSLASRTCCSRRDQQLLLAAAAARPVVAGAIG